MTVVWRKRLRGVRSGTILLLYEGGDLDYYTIVVLHYEVVLLTNVHLVDLDVYGEKQLLIAVRISVLSVIIVCEHMFGLVRTVVPGQRVVRLELSGVAVVSSLSVAHNGQGFPLFHL